MQIFCYLFRNDYVAFKAETWDETIKLLEWKNLYLVKLKKELTQPIQQLFRPVHITVFYACVCGKVLRFSREMESFLSLF